MYEVIDVLAKAGYSIITNHRNGQIELTFMHDHKPTEVVYASSTRQALIAFISDLLKASLEAE